MKITALLENTTAQPGLATEHGLSLYIETDTRSILFDTGQSSRFAENADTLGKDLAAIRFAVLSHGHYDHGGGLATFFKRNSTAPVYLSCYAFEPHYHGPERYIGLDPALLEHEARLRFLDDDTVLDDRCTLYAGAWPSRQYPLDTGGLHVLEHGALRPEDFRHEQYLLIREGSRRVLFSGCSHRGILEIMRRFRPDVLVGGFHFSKLPLDDILADYARELARYPAEYYTCHCTGCEQFQFMKRYIDRLHYLSCGQTITLS